MPLYPWLYAEMPGYKFAQARLQGIRPRLRGVENTNHPWLSKHQKKHPPRNRVGDILALLVPSPTDCADLAGCVLLAPAKLR